MRAIDPRWQDESLQQERQRTAGLGLLLVAVVAGFVLQVAFMPREAQAVGTTRLASVEKQVAAFMPPATSPRPEHDFLQPRTRPSRLRPVTRSRLGLAQPTPVRTSSPVGATQRTPSSPARAERTPPAQIKQSSVARVAIAGRQPKPAPRTDSIDDFQVADAREPSTLPEGVAASTDHEADSEDSELDLDETPVDPKPPAGRDQDPTRAHMTMVGPADAREGDLVIYAVSVEGVRDIAHSPVRLTFDPRVLEFVEAAEGALLSSDGAPTRFQVGHGGGEGVVDVLVSRTEPGRGLTGSGVLFTVTFLARATGESPILIAGSKLVDAAGRRIPFLSEDTALSVRP